MGAATLDMLGIYKGYAVAIETKAPGKKMTPRQQAVAQAIADAGGMWFVVDNYAEIDFVIGRLQCL